MICLVKFTPLEKYSFGTNQGFTFLGVDEAKKGTYFVRSHTCPEQTTILGTLRYLVLKNKRLVQSNFSYTKEQQEQIATYIGANSFCFSAKEKQDFGLIESVSPIFLMNEKNEYLVPNPFHNKASKQGFESMKMSMKKIETSAGEIFLPSGKEEYDAKEGYASGYYNLTTGEIETELFQKAVLTGNRKNGKENESDDDCFFKKEVVNLKKGYSFAVYVNLKEDVFSKTDFCYMGLQKSLFSVSVQKVQKNDLEAQIKKAFQASTEEWFYALSDVVLEEPVSYNTFCIVEEKQIQNLETVYNEKKYIGKLKKSNIQYNIVKSGSVFAGECPFKLENENHKQIGYNQLVQVGGKRK